MLLLFSDNAEFGSQLAKALRQDGIAIASHDPDFAESVCKRIDFCGVILDGRQKPREFAELSQKLFLTYPDLPIAFLTQTALSVFPCATRILFPKDSEQLFDSVLEFCRDCMGEENYATFALQHSQKTESFTYLGYPLTLSNYEHRLLLCLFRHAPQAVGTDELLSTAFPNAHTPQGTLSTMVKRINDAAKRISGLKLVQSVYGKGYRLCDGIVRTRTTQQPLTRSTP